MPPPVQRLALFLALTVPLAAHVGSPDIFFEGKAGPYPAQVTIRPPVVIPGVAEVEIRIPVDGIREVRVVPLPLTGAGSNFPPSSDQAKRSREDPYFYTCSVWLMAFGSFQVRVEVDGPQGTSRLSVPIPATASQVKSMDRPLGIALFAMMLLLVGGFVTIAGAAVRDAKLEPGVAPDLKRDPKRERSALIVMAVTGVVVAAIIVQGFRWWGSDETTYLSHVYKPLAMEPARQGANLTLKLTDPGWFRFRKTDDFIPDHGHLMHLFLVRLPGLDRMWHLHPELQSDGAFALDLPSIPAGKYKLFADIVHANGFPETMVAETTLPEIAGRKLKGDDSEGTAPPVTETERTISPLGDGYRMVWQRAAAPLKPHQLTNFTFRLEDAAGKPADGMQLYMGMPGHAEFISDDTSAFAHVHPNGSVPMASLMLTHLSMQHASGAIPPQVSFPYGFPKAGHYRIFVQMQRAGVPETGVFDALVKDASKE